MIKNLLIKLNTLSFNRRVVWFFALLLFVIAQFTIYQVLKNQYNSGIASYTNNLKTTWEEEYDSVVRSYKTIADVIAQNIIANKALSAALSMSNEKNATVQANELLLSELDSIYKKNQNISLEILQIQNEAGDVLVRFQKPDAYGDNVLKFRKLLANVHKNHNVTYGFEMGRFFDAYRYVSPVIVSGKFIGSIELGIKESQIRKTLMDNFGIGVYISLKPSHELKLASDTTQFSPSFLANSLYHTTSSYTNEELKLLKKIFDAKSKESENAVSKNQDIAFYAKADNDGFTVITKPFFDYSNKQIGYITFYHKDTILPTMEKEFYYSLMMSMLALLLFVVGIYMSVHISKIAIRLSISKNEAKDAARVNELLLKQARELEELNIELDSANEEAKSINKELLEQSFKLAISEEKFRQMFENTRNGIVVYEALDDGEDFIFTNFNSSAEKIECIKREELLGKRITKIFPSVKEFGFLDALKEVYESGKPKDFPIGFYKDYRISGWRENFIYKLSIGEIVVIYDDITAQKQAEEAIKIAFENLKKAESLSKLGSWSLDLVTNKLEWSDEIFNIFEIDKEKFPATYEAFLNAIHPDDRAAVNDAYTNSLVTKQKYEISHRLLMSDGRIKYVHEMCESHFDNDGIPLRSIGTVQDITERKKVEDALTESENYLRTIIDLEPECIKIIDAQGRLSYMNPAGLEMIEARLEQVKGKEVLGIITPEYREAFMDMHSRVLAGEKVHLIFETIGLKGKHCWLETTSVPLHFNGETVLLGITRDITERKQMEEALKYSEERLKLAAQSGGVGIWEWELESNTLIWDDAMFALYGAKKDDFPSAYEAHTSHIHKDDADYVAKALQDSIDGIKPYSIEFRVVHLDGSIHFIKANATVLRDMNGKALRIIGTNWDITKNKETELTLKEFNEELEKKVTLGIEQIKQKEQVLVQQSKMAAMGEMIGAIAHQWKQPLYSLSLTVQDVKDAYNFGELDKNYIEASTTKSMGIIRHMAQTIEDFKNFFSLNKTKQEFFIEDAIGNTLNILNAQLKAHSIDIVFSIDKSNRHKYICFKNELEHVFLNIISNAKDALLEKRATILFIKIDVYESEQNTTITIEDSAGGVPESIMDKIFEPHFTTKPADKGTGIGLYISKEIVEEHLHGRLFVENTQNGAKFIIELPHENY